MMYMVARNEDNPATSSVRAEKGGGSGTAETDMAGRTEKWKGGRKVVLECIPVHQWKNCLLQTAAIKQ
jgi:hypothetical protein